MPTVNIGGRDFDVKPATLGFLKRKLMPARKALAAASEEETPDRLAELIHCYVGHNGVTVEELLDLLPADPRQVMLDCIVASGQQPREVKAEARPEASSP